MAEGEKPDKSYFSEIDNQVLNNPDCAANYSKDRFSVVARARNEFELHTLKSIFIQTLNPELCNQKKFVYKTRLFKI